MLFLVGIGLGSVDDITVRGLRILKRCDYIYLDMYTSIISNLEDDLKLICDKKIILADREMVEQGKEIIDCAKTFDVSFIVVGDPLSATTHTSLIIKAVDEGVPYEVIHNASIITAIGCSGLQLYNFGITVSIPFWDEFGKPESFFDHIEQNFENGFHTLCLLDIKVKEQSLENLLKDRKIYEAPRFMSCQQAALQINEIVLERKNNLKKTCLNSSCLVICLARIGSSNQSIVLSTLEFLSSFDNYNTLHEALGGPLHSMIIPGRIQNYESEFLLTRYRSETVQKYLPQIIVGNCFEATSRFEYFSTLILDHNKLVNVNICNSR